MISFSLTLATELNSAPAKMIYHKKSYCIFLLVKSFHASSQIFSHFQSWEKKLKYLRARYFSNRVYLPWAIHSVCFDSFLPTFYSPNFIELQVRLPFCRFRRTVQEFVRDLEKSFSYNFGFKGFSWLHTGNHFLHSLFLWWSWESWWEFF